MRLRNIKGSKEFIEQSPFVVHHPEDYKGCWHNLFHNNNPVHLEIGMGKGQFIHTLAEQNPKINYIGIEMYSSVLYRALERRAETELDNLFFIRFVAKTFLIPGPKTGMPNAGLPARSSFHCMIRSCLPPVQSSSRQITELSLIIR